MSPCSCKYRRQPSLSQTECQPISSKIPIKKKITYKKEKTCSNRTHVQLYSYSHLTNLKQKKRTHSEQPCTRRTAVVRRPSPRASCGIPTVPLQSSSLLILSALFPFPLFLPDRFQILSRDMLIIRIFFYFYLRLTLPVPIRNARIINMSNGPSGPVLPSEVHPRLSIPSPNYTLHMRLAASLSSMRAMGLQLFTAGVKEHVVTQMLALVVSARFALCLHRYFIHCYNRRFLMYSTALHL